MKYIYNLFLFFFIAFKHSLIYSHGFNGNTMVKLYSNNPAKSLESWQSIKQIYDYTLDQYLNAKSYHDLDKRWSYQPIKIAGSSKTNCYMCIQLDKSTINAIECTPSQEFYDADKNCWIPACQLYAGQFLLCDPAYNKLGRIQIINVMCITKPLEVYTLEIENNHTYLVTYYALLTHNKELSPCFYYALIESFCNSATVGSTIGSTFGPAGAISGLLIGGIIAVGFSYIFEDWDRVWYQIKYDVERVLYIFNTIKKEFDQRSQLIKRSSYTNIKFTGQLLTVRKFDESPDLFLNWNYQSQQHSELAPVALHVD